LKLEVFLILRRFFRDEATEFVLNVIAINGKRKEVVRDLRIR
jgi:hypothetical protein